MDQTRSLRCMNTHPEDVRRRLTAADPSIPWVTWYGPFSPNDPPPTTMADLARVELSRATFDNWVAKAAGLLADEFDVTEGTDVGIDLSVHWLAPVWVWAVWSLGGCAVLPNDDADTHVPLAIVDQIETPFAAADSVVLSTTHPLAMPANVQPPAGWFDAMTDIRMFPDVRSAPLPAADGMLIRAGHQTLDCAAAHSYASDAAPADSQRILVAAPDLSSVKGVLDACLVGPASSATTILTHTDDTAVVAEIASQERVDITL